MIRVDDRGGVRVLTLEHGKVNALDVELLEALHTALGAAQEDSPGAIVLTGAGASFSAGVDLYRILDGGRVYIERYLPLLSACLMRLFVLPKPVVAAVNGHAIAGGAILAWACDRRLMAAGRGRIGVPELLVGVPFPVAALEIVRAATSDRVAAELALTGATCLPEEALQRAYIDAVVAPEALLDAACTAAESLRVLPPGAFALVKKQLRAPALARCERLGLAHDRAVSEAWCDPTSAAAIRAYLERTIARK